MGFLWIFQAGDFSAFLYSFTTLHWIKEDTLCIYLVHSYVSDSIPDEPLD